MKNIKTTMLNAALVIFALMLVVMTYLVNKSDGQAGTKQVKTINNPRTESTK